MFAIYTLLIRIITVSGMHDIINQVRGVAMGLHD